MPHSPRPLLSRAAHPLRGDIRAPGDKSISHRALICGAMNLGATVIKGLLEGEDVLHTAQALRHLGVGITQRAHEWEIQGVGVGGLSESDAVLDMGNSGTGARLLMGLVASHPFVSFFCGDASLHRRPMQRVCAPLTQMGAAILSRSGGRMPLAVTGSDALLPIAYTLPVASAQVKSAILLAGLNTAGRTAVIEPERTRDHTEIMLRHFGAQIESGETEGGWKVTLTGRPDFAHKRLTLDVPSDPSSAAFAAVAALIVKGSEVRLRDVCVNPLRTGLFATLKEMGADLRFENEREQGGERVADLLVRGSALKAVRVPAHRAPSMIDEYPILAVAAAFAEGETVMEGLGELRVKESDRFGAILAGLEACGVEAKGEGDTLRVRGGKVRGGGSVKSRMDHRIAMSFLVLGMASEHPVRVDDGTMIRTSFPDFVRLMNGLGADLEAVDAEEHHYFVLPPRATPAPPLKIAIDGPAASGKGTLARRLADHFGYSYLDTGSLYRAVGLKLHYADQDPHDEHAAVAAAMNLIVEDLANPRLRQEHIGKAASIVSANRRVREALLDFQRRFSKRPEGAVLDGRDIGTVVCPEADVKLFVTADLESRARRRHKELEGEGIEVVYDSVLEDLRERDERDMNRNAAPLQPAPNAIVLDTTDMDANAVFVKAVEIVEAAIRGKKA